MNDYAGLVEYIVRNMVDHPDAVVVEAQPGRGRSQTIEISLDPEDVGRVIGKGGRNIEAIRAVVKAASIKDHERVNVEVLADELPPAAAPEDAAEGESPVDAAASEEAGAEGEAETGEAPIATDAAAETTDPAPEHHAEVHDAAE
jgi:predicted RNA-binding protein YlqC (UPF0109 family)